MKNLRYFFRSVFLVTAITRALYAPAQPDPDSFPAYSGDDLGVTYTPTETKFRIWAPTASALVLRLYEAGSGGKAIRTDSLSAEESGTWIISLKGNWKNHYYTLQAGIGGAWKEEVPDMYAKAVGVNGDRGMIVDLKETDPEGWAEDQRPPLKSPNDIILWEAHVRDFSVHPSSGITHKGKFLAFTEKGTKNPQGEKTGLDHLVDLGITHIHLLPAFDFNSIDETRLEANAFNWGYDPKNYNVPEGSYSTDPHDGRVRIREFKEMVKTLHENGIRVIMDVVYNHVFHAPSSSFEQLVPGYYFRMNEDGSFSNGSACGNETASERAMMRKFMIESVVHWVREYHVDGFRFDLMGLHDIETMKAIRAALDEIDPSIYVYGEGWLAGDSPLPPDQRAVKGEVSRLGGVAVFSDDIRDGIRGSWFRMSDAGFMCGKAGIEESIRFGVVAASGHPQIRFQEVNYSKQPYSADPASVITYVTCHDNPCLWDKITVTCEQASESEKLMAQRLANAIVLTSQGVSFLHAGEELVRTKHGVENSYNAPDSINWLDWTRKSRYNNVYRYYRGLIRLRKNHPAFRMPTNELINQHLTFFEMQRPLLVGYRISGNANGDAWKNILVYFNGSSDEAPVNLPKGEWRIVANGNEIDERGLKVQGFDQPVRNLTTVPARSMLMLVDSGSVR